MNKNMNSVPTLLSSCIAKYYPAHMKEIIDLMETKNIDTSFIIQDINRYETSLEYMINFNVTYDPWCGLPHRIEAYTIRPDLLT